MFSLMENSPIIIYGAATSGKIIYEILQKNGLEVAVFIDKRADELNEVCGRRVVASVDEIECVDVGACIVIIAVKNVFEHSRIASAFVRKGIHKILYKPYAVLAGEGSEDEKSISACYDCLLNNEIRKLTSVAETWNVISYICDDSAFIKEEGEWVWARVPVCLIYANKTNDRQSIWGDIPVLSMFPHIGLFREFLCNPVQNGIESYVEFCCEAAQNVGNIETTKRWKQNVISNRLDVFYNMEMAYELDKDFFIRNAPQARWNDAGYFNLLGGKHRCTFLAAKGDQYIPLQVSKEDYASWINSEKIQDIKESLEESCRSGKGRGVIEHPYFYKYPLDGGCFIHRVWVAICEFLSQSVYSKWHRFSFEGMTALVSVDDMGYIARNLRRMGIKVYRKTEKILVEQKIGEAVGTPINHYIEKESTPKVDLAVVEDEEYEGAKICFVVSGALILNKERQEGWKMLLEGYVFPEKRYLYLISDEEGRGW